MHQESIIDRLPPARVIRCTVCNSRLFDTASYGLIYSLCRKCKCFQVVLDGSIVYASKSGTDATEHGGNGAPAAHRPSIEEIMDVMETRWKTLQVERAIHKATVAVGIRFNVFMRDDFRCRYCGRSASDGVVLEVDHVAPRSKGGADEMANLVTACWECNRGKSDKGGINSPLA